MRLGSSNLFAQERQRLGELKMRQTSFPQLLHTRWRRMCRCVDSNFIFSSVSPCTSVPIVSFRNGRRRARNTVWIINWPISNSINAMRIMSSVNVTVKIWRRKFECRFTRPHRLCSRHCPRFIRTRRTRRSPAWRIKVASTVNEEWISQICPPGNICKKDSSIVSCQLASADDDPAASSSSSRRRSITFSFFLCLLLSFYF